MTNTPSNIPPNSIMDNYVKNDDIFKDMCVIIDSSREAAYQAVKVALVQSLSKNLVAQEMQQKPSSYSTHK